MDNELINRIKNNFINNETIILAYKSDIKNNKKNVDFKKFEEIIDYFQMVNPDDIDNTNKFNENIVVYYGDIYLTFYLCMQAILKKKKLKLYMENYLFNTNKAIIETFNKILKEYQLEEIEYDLRHLIKDILNIVKSTDNVYVIGNTFAYQELKSINNLKFYPFFNLLIYFDSNGNEKYQRLFKLVLYYSETNNFEYEVINEQYENIIDYINEDIFSSIVFAIANTENIKNLFKENIKDKKVFINANPFKDYDNNILDHLKKITI